MEFPRETSIDTVGATSEKRAKPKAGVARARTPGISRSVARALNILLETARAEKPLSFVELQKRLKVPKATLHKLLYTLEATNFLNRDEDSAKYSIGLAALEVNAGRSARPGDLRSILDPILHRLVDEWNETCHLCVLDAGEEIILDRLDPAHQVVRLATQVGRRHPAYAGAGGLAGLALFPDRIALEGLPARLPTLTKNTIKTRDELRVRLKEVREKGYALDLEEAHLGVRCVGVAVAVPGWPVVAIAFSLPLQRASIERLRALARPLMAAAKEAERVLRLTSSN